jgi:hypothetical protein
VASFLNLQDEVVANFTSNVRARAKIWLNAAYHEFLAARRWSFLESTSAAVPLVASQQGYVLLGTSPVVADFAGMIAVEMELTSGLARVKLIEADPQLFSQLSAHSRQNAIPALWSVFGGLPAASAAAVVSGGQQQLVVWPLPLATAGNGVNLFIRYDRSAASIEMTADSDVPIMPAQHHMALVYGANAIGYDSFNQPDLGQVQRGMFQQRLQAALREDDSMRLRDNERLQIVQQPWQYPIVGGQGQQNQQPPPSDPYPPQH